MTHAITYANGYLARHYGLKLTPTGEAHIKAWDMRGASTRQAAELTRTEPGAVKPMTKAEVANEGKRLRMLIQWKGETGEFRVAFPYGEGTNEDREASAYYATDAADAIATALTMRNQRDDRR